MTAVNDYVPQGVIPATLAAFDPELRFDWAETRRHLAFVAATDGVDAVTVNGHASEVHACSIEEQTRMMAVAAEEVGDRLPLVCGVYADGSLEAARIARMAEAEGASALLCFPPHSLGMGGIRHRPEMGVAHMKTIADATPLPMIVFQYADELAYPLDTLVRMCEEVPSIRAVKDWSPPQRHERNIRTLHGLPRPVNVLSTNSAWLMSSLVMGADGLLSGAGSVIADLHVALLRAVRSRDLATAQALSARVWHTTEAFYRDPFGDMHNRMKEALVLLGRMAGPAVVRPPLVKLPEDEIRLIDRALKAAGIAGAGAEAAIAAE